MRFLLFCGVAVMLSGCAQKEWLSSYDGQRLSEHSPEYLQCQYETDKAVAAIAEPFARGWQRQKLFQQCLGLKGYQQVTISALQ